ncbi:ParB/RepB/Spo0J family partition protein [Variovorax ginsengisoli]|uniref:ParB/RepB/Spo0J family partition protein n=1 Tax=Variovorax ginsengisoli TaxID=363844 RepID=A0ABT9SE49_9BURK|nr:ParB/RepB/Spo0J family partition protein [Variovorax ginsengisoli]MDP9902638.1 ParB/RepB/Spo0J family partition protein [Variovorax ginsengisoli]
MSLTDTSTSPDGTPIPDDLVRIDGEQFDMLELALVVPSRTNPRTTFNETKLAELTESIKASGVHQPVLVRPLPGSRVAETFADRRKSDPLPTHEIVSGERRYRASIRAGKARIPAMIRTLTDSEVLEIQIVENLQRDDLTELEEAEGYQRLCTETGVAKEDIGAKIGKSRSYVYARMKLLDLTSAPREALRTGAIDSSRALQIARIPDSALQQKALDKAVEKDYQGSTCSYRNFVLWVHQNVMLRLDKARFKITDATLVPEAGSCKECPKRTGANPDLFADVDSADVCIDPKCFNNKQAVHDEARVATAQAAGQQIITEREAKKLWAYDSIYTKIDGYTRLDLPDDRLESNKKLKNVLGKDAPQPILFQNPYNRGELIEVLPTEKVNEILKERGLITPTQAKAQRSISAGEAKRKAEEKFERTWRKRAITKTYNAMADDASDEALSDGVIRLICKELIGGLTADERTHTCELLGLGKIGEQTAILTHIQECEPRQASRVAQLLLMQHDTRYLVSYGTGKATETLRIDAVATDFFVDLKAIKAEVRDELKPVVKKPGARAKAAAPTEAMKPKPVVQKKNVAPPAAQKIRARKTSAEEVTAQVAAAFQALDQAPNGAKLEEVVADAAASATPDAGAASVAEVIDQAPVGAGGEEAAGAAGDAAATAEGAPVETNLAPAATQGLSPATAWPFPKAKATEIQDDAALIPTNGPWVSEQPVWVTKDANALPASHQKYCGRHGWVRGISGEKVIVAFKGNRPGQAHFEGSLLLKSDPTLSPADAKAASPQVDDAKPALKSQAPSIAADGAANRFTADMRVRVKETVKRLPQMGYILLQGVVKESYGREDASNPESQLVSVYFEDVSGRLKKTQQFTADELEVLA